MKARQVRGTVVAVLLASGMAAYAQGGSPPDMKPGGVPGMNLAAPQGDMPPPGPPDRNAGGPLCERMASHDGAHGLPAMMPPSPEGMRNAGATEQQVQALEEFMFDQQMKRIDLRAAVEKADLALERLLRAAHPDEQAVMQAVDVLNEVRGELFKLDVTAGIKVKQTLGDEILRKLQKQGPPDCMDGGGDGPGGVPQDASPRDVQHDPPAGGQPNP
jgi:hypothetical protein